MGSGFAVIEQPEKLWDYDAVEPGQSGSPIVVTITKEDISWLCASRAEYQLPFHAE